MDWTWKHIAIWVIPLAIVVLALVVWFFVRKTIRTRLRMVQQLRLDPQVSDWLVMFNWTRKVLYVPVVVASLLAAGLLFIGDLGWVKYPEGFQAALGGIWMLVFFVNLLVDEYEMNLKVLLLVVLAIAVIMMWLTLMDWIVPFFHGFKHLGVHIDALGYVMFAAMFTLAISVSWVKGLFYYVAITPNYMNVQSGPNETSEQISREAYSTRIDTGDFLERVLGFGQIIITFTDTRRQPMVLMVGRIGKRAVKLESLRSHLDVESVRPTPNVPDSGKQ